MKKYLLFFLCLAVFSLSVAQAAEKAYMMRKFMGDRFPDQDTGPVWQSPAAGSLGSIDRSIDMQAIVLLATDADVPVAYSLSGGELPPGVVLAGDTISGRPAAEGTYTFTIAARDGKDLVTPRSFSLDVVVPVYGIVANGAGRKWADSTFAANCAGYFSPPAGYAYAGLVGSGIYTIKPTPDPEYNVVCDMDTAGGGWTLCTSITHDLVNPSGFASLQEKGFRMLMDKWGETVLGNMSYGQFCSDLTFSGLYSKTFSDRAGTLYIQTAPVSVSANPFRSDLVTRETNGTNYITINSRPGFVYEYYGNVTCAQGSNGWPHGTGICVSEIVSGHFQMMINNLNNGIYGYGIYMCGQDQVCNEDADAVIQIFAR